MSLISQLCWFETLLRGTLWKKMMDGMISSCFLCGRLFSVQWSSVGWGHSQTLKWNGGPFLMMARGSVITKEMLKFAIRHNWIFIRKVSSFNFWIGVAVVVGELHRIGETNSSRLFVNWTWVFGVPREMGGVPHHAPVWMHCVFLSLLPKGLRKKECF